jgi:two-component system CitB family sensor kinase
MLVAARPEIVEQERDDLLVELRAQAHEYANRIHALAGLLELEMTQEAREFLGDCRRDHESGSAALAEAINIPALAGLLIRKKSEAARAGIVMTIDPTSAIERLPSAISELDCVTIVGNLIDNAFDATGGVPNVTREVQVGIYGEADEARICVSNEAPGIQASLVDELASAGVTTKRGHLGLGLFIVTELLRKVGGRLDFEWVDGWTTFEASVGAGSC